MSKLKLSIATTDYDHFRDFRMGDVRAEGIDHNWLKLGHHECFARFTAQPRVRRVGTVLREIHDAGDPRRIRHHRPAGRLLAPVPLLVVLREQEERHQDGAGPQGQARRLARMGAFGRRLHARLDAQRMRREAHGRALVSGRRQCAGPRREGRAEPARRREAHARRRQVAVRNAGVGRDRLRHHRASADLLPRRRIPMSCASIPTTSAWKKNTTPAHEGVADHAHHRDEEAASSTRTRGWRAISTTRSWSSKRRSRRAPVRSCRVALSAARGCRPMRARCATCSAAIPSLTASRKTAPTWEQMLLYTYQQGIAHKHVKPEDIFPKGIMTKVIV